MAGFNVLEFLDAQRIYYDPAKVKNNNVYILHKMDVGVYVGGMKIIRWRPIPGTQRAYWVSDDGRVKSKSRRVWYGRGYRRTRPRMLRLQPSGRYLMVSIFGIKRSVHTLVLLAFRGPKPFPKAWGRHLNDVGHDNRLSNLEWGTPRQNLEDRIRNSGCSGHTKLTPELVREIRRLYERRGRRDSNWLAKRFGVYALTIRNVLKGRTWRHVI